MKRRTAIRDMIVFAGGITLLPSCMNGSDTASIALDNISITAAQEDILGAIAATIIPQTETLGAREVDAHLFVMKMLDDCYEMDVQQRFIKGLDILEAETEKRLGKSFSDCTAQQRAEILMEVEKKGPYTAEVFEFYEIMKKRTLQGYQTSKYYLTHIMKYEFIPSVQYDGYYPVKNLRAK